jgi:hypothetical protein
MVTTPAKLVAGTASEAERRSRLSQRDGGIDDQVRAVDEF